MAERSVGVVGEYPYWCEDEDDRFKIHFESKENPGRGTVFNLIFHTASAEKRARIKEIFSELERIDR